MSTPNPLVPHGSNLEQAARSKSTLSIAAFIVGAHAAVFLGLLLIGCRRENHEATDLTPTNSVETAVQPGADTNSFAGLPGTNGVVDPYSQPINFGAAAPGAGATNPPGYQPGGYAGQPPISGDPYAQPVTPATSIGQPESHTAAPASGSDYKIKKGDIAYNIAKKNGISLKALKDANPGVDLAKLKEGQTIILPGAAPAELSHTKAAVADAGTATASDSVVTYTVKSGDTLTKIAKKYGTTAKAIRKSSGLSSDVIKAGQKLKIPSKVAAAPAVTEPAPITAPAPAPTYAPSGYNPPPYNPAPQPGAPR